MSATLPLSGSCCSHVSVVLRSRQLSGPPATYSTWPETKPASSPREEGDGVGDVLGPADALHGDLGGGGGLEVLEAHADALGGGGGHVGDDEAGGDGVGGDAELAELLGEGLGEALQTGLGGGVVDLAAVAERGATRRG